MEYDRVCYLVVILAPIRHRGIMKNANTRVYIGRCPKIKTNPSRLRDKAGANHNQRQETSRFRDKAGAIPNEKGGKSCLYGKVGAPN